MVTTPKAVRVKTTDGWQDIGYQGPPGPPSGQMQLIQEVVLTGAQASIDFLNIPQTFAHLQLYAYARSSDAQLDTDLALRLNNDSSASYFYQYQYAAGASVVGGELGAQTRMGLGVMPGANAPAGFFGQSDILIENYTSTVGNKIATGRAFWLRGTGGGSFIIRHAGGGQNVIGVPITRLTVFPAAGNFVAGTRVGLYGIKAEPEGLRQNWNDHAIVYYAGASAALGALAANTWKTVPLGATPKLERARRRVYAQRERLRDDPRCGRLPGRGRRGDGHARLPHGLHGGHQRGRRLGHRPPTRRGLRHESRDPPRGRLGTIRATVPNVTLFVNFAAGVALTGVILDSFSVHRTGAGPPGPPGSGDGSPRPTPSRPATRRTARSTRRRRA